MSSSSDKIFDVIIVGAGPSGLTFATLCALNNIKVLLIEKEDAIGGCHRVNRVIGKTYNEKIFTEHGPRIYSSSFLNFKNILKIMNLNFYDLFIPYKFNSLELVNKSLLNIFTLRESLILFYNLISFKKNISMKQLMEENNFSDKSKDFIDGLCRITDGAGYDKYSLYQLQKLVNQQSLYGMYQPKKNLDKGLFKYWYNFLTNTKNVDIKLMTEITNCDTSSSKDLLKIIDTNNNIYYGKKLIIACPPLSIINIIKKINIPDAFGDLNKLENFSKESAYLDYIPIIFHWDKKIKIPSLWDFPPTSEWKIAFTVLSDYMEFEEKSSKTVLSSLITKTNYKSSYLNKDANNCSKEELISETFRQLNLLNLNLPQPTESIISPNVYKDEINNIWKNKDTAFFNSVNLEKKFFKSDKYDNIYTLGTHNGNSNYYFTSFESAVSNAISAFNELEIKDNEKKINIETPIELFSIIFYIIIILICFIILSKYDYDYLNIGKIFY